MNQAGTFVRSINFALMLLGLALTVSAQTPTPTPTPQTPVGIPTAIPGDVATMDSIVAAVYDVISGPAAQKRSWDRFRSLFIPGGPFPPAHRPVPTDDSFVVCSFSRIVFRLHVLPPLSGARRTLTISFSPATVASRRRHDWGAAAHLAAVSYSATLEIRDPAKPRQGDPNSRQFTRAACG